MKFWPLSCSDDEIDHQTPRQTFELWRQLGEMRDSLSAVTSPSEATPGDPHQSQPANSPHSSPEHEESEPEFGIRGVPALNLNQYDCFAPCPGEDDANPFSVPREIARDRWYALVVELSREGNLVSHGVPKDNPEAARNFFDQTWGENERVFRGIVSALDMPRDAGLTSLITMGRHGSLRNYKVEPGDDRGAAALYDHLAKCYSHYKENPCRSEPPPPPPK